MILYTSDTNRKVKKHFRITIITYLAISAFCILFDRVYALFGHGVYSASMSLMFLYPLGGTVFFSALRRLAPGAVQAACYRFFYNCFNSGIAALTVGSLLYGIFEIAGTSSSYMVVFTVCGWALCAAGLLGFLNSLRVKHADGQR